MRLIFAFQNSLKCAYVFSLAVCSAFMPLLILIAEQTCLAEDGDGDINQLKVWDLLARKDGVDEAVVDLLLEAFISVLEGPVSLHGLLVIMAFVFIGGSISP